MNVRDGRFLPVFRSFFVVKKQHDPQQQKEQQQKNEEQIHRGWLPTTIQQKKEISFCDQETIAAMLD